MPPTIVSSDAHRCWFKSPVSIVQPSHEARRPTTAESIMCNSSSFDLLTKPNYPELVSDKEGLPLICNGYLPYNSSRSYWSKPQRPVNVPHVSNATEASTKAALNSTCNDYLNSENCLPRIIKPRKRRKKDRKPVAMNLSSTSASTDSTTTMSSISNVSDGQNAPVRVTDSWSRSSVHQRDEDGGLRVASFCGPSTKLKSLNCNTTHSFDSTNVICRSLSNVLSEGATPTGSLQAEDLCEQDDEQQVDDSSSRQLFCNCKYCDPESNVWDVRQRCFSPNLMAPQTMTRTEDPSHQVNASKYCSTINLRRSSSEPASKPLTSPAVTRVRSFSSSCDKRSQNLLVSSQIVTSHDGHRDIEIKFFSLPKSSSSSSSDHSSPSFTRT